MRVQSGRRSRGRNRKGPSPLSRSYESNGPDVKIRGTASHIADKYTQLARDAHASGDTIAAENYHQHAEHYLRIIAAAQAQMNERQENQERQDNPDRQQQSGDDTNPNANADAAANGHGNGRSEEKAEASADANADTQARDGDQDAGENQSGPRRRRRRSPRNAEASADQGDAVTGQSTNGGTPYPTDQPQPEIDEPA